MIIVSDYRKVNERRILLRFDYDFHIKEAVKSIPGSKYSNTMTGWHIPYTKESWRQFLNLGFAYERNTEYSKINDTTICKIENEINSSGNVTLPTGTALRSASPSDNAGIKSSPVEDLPSEDPSYADSKDSDIHLSKGGREVLFSRGQFVISIFYNELDVQFLKSLKAWWHASSKKWIVKGNAENLVKLQDHYSFWDEEQYAKIEDCILLQTNPYLVTLYQVPDYKDKVAIVISGYRANVMLIKKICDRLYQKEEKRWLVPNERQLIERIISAYTEDGATINSRLPKVNYDYEKHKASYGDWKNHWLRKTEPELKVIVETYINTLIAQRYSLRTFDVYLGPFIQFVKHFGVTVVSELNSEQIRNYLAGLSAKKVSDSYLHNVINCIKFYYHHVIHNDQLEISEIVRPKKGKVLPNILSEGEIDRILRSTENLKHTTLLYTLYSSGIRLNEILNLKIKDLWWDRNQVMIKSGKGKKDRVVPLSVTLKILLLKYFEEYKPIYWLFEGQDRVSQYSARSVQNVVKACAKKAGIHKKVSPHTIRHCYATHLMDGGTDVRYIQELLGHADIKTTLIYTHVTTNQLSQIESPLDRLMRKRAEKTES